MQHLVVHLLSIICLSTAFMATPKVSLVRSTETFLFGRLPFIAGKNQIEDYFYHHLIIYSRRQLENEYRSNFGCRPGA